MTWSWGVPTRQGRAALEILHAMGELGIHHRSGTRRYFDLIERLLPAEVLACPDPNQTVEAYQDWHVLRRVGSLGLAGSNGTAECWLGILDLKANARRAALARLLEQGDVVAAEVEGVLGTCFLRTRDLPTLDAVGAGQPPAQSAAFLAPLDNLIWDRQMVRRLFGFGYKWEVYTPVEQRKHGYYVLPVLYGDRFVARLEPTFDKKTRELVIRDWWWEEGVEPDGAMEAALQECLCEFERFLGAGCCRIGPSYGSAGSLGWAEAGE